MLFVVLIKLFALIDKAENIGLAVAGFPVNDEIIDSVLCKGMVSEGMEELCIDSYSVSTDHCDLMNLFNGLEACRENFGADIMLFEHFNDLAYNVNAVGNDIVA